MRTDFGIRLLCALFPGFMSERIQDALRRGEPVVIDLGIPPLSRGPIVGINAPGKLPPFQWGWL
jgi:hypothetical protein